MRSTILACVCFVVRTGAAPEVLLLRRNHEPFGGLYDGLGGHIKFGEAPAQAVIREVREESGLAVEKPDYRGHLLLYEAKRGRAVSAHLFVAADSGENLKPSPEGLPEWVLLDRAPELDLVGFVRTTMPLVLAPDTFLTGTIWHDAKGYPERYLLDYRTLSGLRQLVLPS